MKLMIVEDEMFVRIGLENALDWASLGVELVASASDGAEALERYRQLGADLIITDIKMPKMSGIELITEIRKTDQSARFIILSCLEDFSIAQEAVRQGVSAYFTKYDMDLVELKKCVAAICAEYARRAPNVLQAVEPSEPDIEKIRMDWLFGENDKADGEVSFRELTGEGYRLQFIQPAVLSEDMSNEKSVSDVLRQLLDSTPCITYLGKREGRIYLLRSGGESTIEDMTEAGEALRNICSRLWAYFNISYYGFISEWLIDPKAAPQRINSLNKLAVLPFYLPEYTSFFAEQDCSAEIFKRLGVHLSHVTQTYVQCFSVDYQDEFSSFADWIEKCDPLELSTIRGLLSQWGHLFLALMHLMSDKINFYRHTFFHRIAKAETLAEADELLCELLHSVREAIDAEPIISTEMMDAIAYIRENLQENISLPAVAKYVNFSPGYLGYLFKRELDVSFTDFVLRLRIKKAKLLLAKTDDKLYAIAERIGFKDPSYFNKVFHRATGLSPSRYRTLQQGGGDRAR